MEFIDSDSEIECNGATDVTPPVWTTSTVI